MKRYFAIWMVLVLLLCAGCAHKGANDDASRTEPTQTELWIPRGLAGQWVSASTSDRGYSETIIFEEDGSLTVSSLKNGVVEQTIYGTYHIEGDEIVFDITSGTSPYSDKFEYVLEGRELYLIDDDNPAHYLRTS